MQLFKMIGIPEEYLPKCTYPDVAILIGMIFGNAGAYTCLRMCLELPLKLIEERDQEYDKIRKIFDAEQDQEKIQKARNAVDIKTSKKFGSYLNAYILCFFSPFVAICSYAYFFHHEFEVYYIADDMFYETLIVSFAAAWWLFDVLLIVSRKNEFDVALLVHHIIVLIALVYTFLYHEFSHFIFGGLVSAESAG